MPIYIFNILIITKTYGWCS